MESRNSLVGVAGSLGASMLFATLYYYTSLSGQQIYGWRILLTAPCLALLLLAIGRWGEVREILVRVPAEARLWLALPLSSALVGLQLWLFMWAPINGHGLDVSLGYFLLPLTLVLTGYPCYFVLRRKLGTASLGGLWVDLVISLPVAALFVLGSGETLNLLAGNPRLTLLIAGLGALSALALGLMINASKYLSLTLFGLLSYVEPVLLVVVALLLGESIAPDQWLTYGAIWAAIVVLVLEGLRALRRGRG